MPRNDYLNPLRGIDGFIGRKGRPRAVSQPASKLITDEQIAAALNACDGIMTKAADRLKCAYSTVFERVQKSVVLQQLQAMYRERSMDFSELHLRKANKKGERWAVETTIKYLGSARGYCEKSKHEVESSVGSISSIVQLTDEQLDALLLRLDKRISDLASGADNQAKG